MIGHALPVFQGYSSQYGHGLGNVLGGVMRAAIPFVSKLAKKAGTQLLDTGINYLQNSLTKRKSSSLGPPAKRRRRIVQTKRVASQPIPVHKRPTPSRGRIIRTKKPRRTRGDIFDIKT